MEGEQSIQSLTSLFNKFITTIRLVKRTEVEPLDRISGIEWNAVEFDRSLRVENVLFLPQVDV